MIDFSLYTKEEQKSLQDSFDELEAIGEEMAERNGWNKEEDDTLSITIKPEALDTSKLQNGSGSKQYRPKSLDEYIGQENAKAIILDFMKGCKEFNEPFPHTFISAPAGHGKTLLAEIVADISGKKVVKTTGGQLKNQQDFVDLISECDGGFILIDEANRIKKDVGFFMLPVIEKFEVNNQSLNPFTVVFMTTHLGDLAKDLDALIQRCDIKLELEHYNPSQLVTILKNYKDKQYPNIEVAVEIFDKIAINCRCTPRISRAFLRSYVYNRDIQKVIKQNRIVKDGITDVDIKVLNYIKSNGGASKASIASFLRVKPQNYEFETEPYLIHKELLEVKNKRKITDKGIQFLKEI